ncbi:MAG: chemotaxis protein CheW [Acidobacteriota bacterium]
MSATPEVGASASALSPTLASGSAQEPAEESRAQSPWVLCESGGMAFAVDLDRVVEVFGASSLLPAPDDAPEAVIAIAQGGGLRVPVVSLARQLGVEEAVEANRRRVLVVSSQGRAIGLEVDRVRSILALERAGRQPVPRVLAGISGGLPAIAGFAFHQQRWLMLLEVDGLLSPRWGRS